VKSVAKWAAESLVGGRLCLDFVNTVAWRAAEESEERLRTYDDLVEWGRVAGLVKPRAAAALRRRAQQDPDEAAATLAQARLLREALYRLLSRLRARRAPEVADRHVLQAALAETPARRRLAWRDGAYAWDVDAADGDLGRLLWPIVWSAADLLVEGETGRIKECAGARCGWLFFDSSRNRSRRWCSMRDCGNRAKVRRHYERTRRQKKPRSRKGPTPPPALDPRR
jgi:predicted RNA-binding Zn ribbon-like protein